jgi:hypothetical protein
MMMQMLEAGGMPILSDGQRSTDEDNLRGYYEFEPVKRLRRDSEWLRQAKGKAVKVIYLLVEELPAGYDYQVIFMYRDLPEVVRSQQAMLERNGKQGAGLGPEEMVEVYRRQLASFNAWLAEQPNFRRLDVAYREAIENSHATCQQIVEFLDLPLDVDAMASVVEPSLYRQRSG